jgi:hypothetical protein
MAFQIFLLSGVIDDCVRELSKNVRYIDSLKRHMKFALFGLIVKALERANPEWGEPELTELLDEQFHAPDSDWKNWDGLVRQAAALIHAHYRTSANRQKQKTGQVLPFANYFKSHGYVGELLAQPLPKTFLKQAKSVLTR